jgi:hypothetical protein
LYTHPIHPLIHRPLLSSTYLSNLNLSQTSGGRQKFGDLSNHGRQDDYLTVSRAAAQMKTPLFLNEEIVRVPLLI